MKRGVLLLILTCPTLLVFGDSPTPLPSDIAVRPLAVTLKNGATLPEGRHEAYDEATGVFHARLPSVGDDGTPGAIEITRVNAGSRKPVVFRLDWVPVWYGLFGSPLRRGQTLPHRPQ